MTEVVENTMLVLLITPVICIAWIGLGFIICSIVKYFMER